jgi:mono/diheme cytochrome c family protein
VRTDWLGSFLRDPEVVRPWGFHPGFGSRHPDFRLTDDEAGALADYLSARTGDAGATGGFEPEELHPFSMRKAEALLRDKQPCLGCHRLGGEGGRIGPDLSSLGSRLQADYVYRIVEDPQAVIEGTVMPKIEMPEATLELIVSYLLQQRLPRERAVYPSLAATPPLPRGREGIEGTYVTRCAACHGVGGKGDGFNAAYLPTPPTPHADSASMSTRPDDTLFDGIYAGGYILGRSHRMPAWGFTLGRDEIRGLVAHLRTLCRCDPPAWTRGHR